jgi:hypothetical protein
MPNSCELRATVLAALPALTLSGLFRLFRLNNLFQIGYLEYSVHVENTLNNNGRNNWTIIWMPRHTGTVIFSGNPVGHFTLSLPSE